MGGVDLGWAGFSKDGKEGVFRPSGAVHNVVITTKVGKQWGMAQWAQKRTRISNPPCIPPWTSSGRIVQSASLDIEGEGLA